MRRCCCFSCQKVVKSQILYSLSPNILCSMSKGVKGGFSLSPSSEKLSGAVVVVPVVKKSDPMLYTYYILMGQGSQRKMRFRLSRSSQRLSKAVIVVAVVKKSDPKSYICLYYVPIGQGSQRKLSFVLSLLRRCQWLSSCQVMSHIL